MAALGWLLNLDFAGGAPSVAPAGSTGTYGTEVRRTRHKYGYGYRYIKLGAGMCLSFLFR